MKNWNKKPQMVELWRTLLFVPLSIIGAIFLPVVNIVGKEGSLLGLLQVVGGFSLGASLYLIITKNLGSPSKALFTGFITMTLFSSFILFHEGGIMVNRKGNFVRSVQSPFEVGLPFWQRLSWVDYDVTPSEPFTPPGVFVTVSEDSVEIKVFVSFRAITKAPILVLWQTSREWKKNPTGDLTPLYKKKVREVIEKYTRAALLEEKDPGVVRKKIVTLLEEKVAQELSQIYVFLSDIKVQSVEWKF